MLKRSVGILLLTGVILFVLWGCSIPNTAPSPTGQPILSPDQVLSATTTPTLQATPTSSPSPTPVLDPKLEKTLGKGRMPAFFRSPDGKLIIVEDEQHHARFLDAETMKPLDNQPNLTLNYFPDVTFSANGKIIALKGEFETYIVDRETLKVISNRLPRDIEDIEFTPDNRYAVFLVDYYTSGGAYKYIGLWDLVKDKDCSENPDMDNDDQGDSHHFPVLFPDRYHTMTAPALSPDGKWVAAGNSDLRIYVWNLVSGKTRFVLKGHSDLITAVAFSPNGRYLASSSKDGTVRLWNAHTGALMRVITGFRDRTYLKRFTKDSQQLIIRVADFGYQKVDLSTGELTEWVEPSPTPDPFEVDFYRQGYSSGNWGPSRVTFSPDGKQVALGNRHVQVWDVHTADLKAVLLNPTWGNVQGMTFSPDNRLMAAVTDSGDVLVWDIASETMSMKVDNLKDVDAKRGIRTRQTIVFSPDGNYLTFGSGPDIEVWDVKQQARVRVFGGEAAGEFGDISGLDYAPDGERLYVIRNQGRIAQIWNPSTGEKIKDIELTPMYLHDSSSISQRGAFFARSNIDEGRDVEIWDLEKGTSIKITAGSSMHPLEFGPDGELLITESDDDGHWYFWKAENGELVYEAPAELKADHVAISPSADILAAGREEVISLYDINGIRQAARSSGRAVLPASTPNAVSTPATTSNPAVLLTAETTSSITETARFGAGTIEQMRWSSDGKTLLLAGSQGVSEYTVPALTETRRISPDGRVFDMVQLADGEIRMIGSKNGHIRVWSGEAPQLLTEIPRTGSLAISPDGVLFVEGKEVDLSQSLEVRDVRTGELVALLWDSAADNLGNPVFSPDSRLVAASRRSDRWDEYSPGSVRVWDVNTGKIVTALGGPANEIKDLSFSNDGQYLIGAADGSAWIWDLRPGIPPFTITLYTGTTDHNLTLFDERVTAVALSPDNQIVAIGTSEHEIRLYRRSNRRELQRWSGHSGAVKKLAFSPDGATLASVDADGEVKLWDVASGKLLNTRRGHIGEIRGMRFRSDGNLAVWQGNTAWVVAPENGQPVQETVIYSGTIFAASPVDEYLVGRSSDDRLSLWDATTGKTLRTLDGKAGDAVIDFWDEGYVFPGFNDADFLADGRQIIAVDTGGTWIFDTDTGSANLHFTVHNGFTIESGKENKSLLICQIFAMQGDQIVLYALNGSWIFVLEQGGKCGYHRSLFSPDNQWIAAILRGTGDTPNRLALIDPATGEEVKRLAFDVESNPSTLAYSPDGRIIAVGRENGRIALVDASSLEILGELPGHRGRVTALAFSLDGRYLASSGDDGIVIIRALK